MKRDRQVGHHRLGREAFERRQDADGRQGHPSRRYRHPVLVGQDPQRLHRVVVVVQRLAHAHQHDIEALIEEAELADEHTDLADDFTGGQVAVDAHLAGQAEGAAHCAADLCGQAERDAVRFAWIGRAGLIPGCRRSRCACRRRAGAGIWWCRPRIVRWRTTDGVRRSKCPASGRAELAAQIAHQRHVGDAAVVDPLEDLPAVKAGLAEVRERLFQLVELRAGDVQSGVVDHWRTLRKGEPSFYYCYAPMAGPDPLSEPVLEKGAASVIEFRFSGSSCNSFYHQ